MARDNTILTTGADHLVEVVKNKDKISLEELSKELKMDMKIVQTLVDFLVEEKVLGIEYKFTTPYVYLSKKDVNTQDLKGQGKTPSKKPVLLSKEEFYEKAKSRDIPYQKISILWRKYLEGQLGKMKQDFFDKSRKRGLPNDQIERLWQRYLSFL